MARFRIAFMFADDAEFGLDDVMALLIQKGERTFEVVDEERWFHKTYESDVSWRHDLVNNVVTASVEGGQAVRTCGSLVEWMLRHAASYLNDVDRELKGISVF